MNEPQVVVVLVEVRGHLFRWGLVRVSGNNARWFIMFMVEGWGSWGADLLLLRSDALWVQVPVRVEVSSGDTQVLDCDGGAVRQVCIGEGREHDLTNKLNNNTKR